MINICIQVREDKVFTGLGEFVDSKEMLQLQH